MFMNMMTYICVFLCVRVCACVCGVSSVVNESFCYFQQDCAGDAGVGVCVWGCIALSLSAGVGWQKHHDA